MNLRRCLRPRIRRGNPRWGVRMATEQLALDLGDYGCAIVSDSSTLHQPTGSHFRGFCGKASAWDTSTVFDAADRAWRQFLPATSMNQSPSRAPQPSRPRAPRSTRVRLGLRDDEPIANMVSVLERLGCAVGAMPGGVAHISAYSCWFDDTPLALLRSSGASRRRGPIRRCT